MASSQQAQPTGQQGQLYLGPNQQGQQQGQQYLSPNQLPQQAYQRTVYFPPKDNFRSRNPTCFWVLIIIAALIVITLISSLINYLMVVWQANKIRDADWDRQYGPDRWEPTATSSPHH